MSQRDNGLSSYHFYRRECLQPERLGSSVRSHSHDHLEGRPHARRTRACPLDEPQIHNEDEAHLAKLGYKQDLNRSWSGFSNFAISFSIISILAGCFTNFGAGFNNGGPISISWSWPILGLFILIIGFTMSELVSAYPTSGGIYWWASKLGGPAAGFFTGWLNLIGLIAVTAGVSYGCATFIDLTLSARTRSPGPTTTR